MRGILVACAIAVLAGCGGSERPSAGKDRTTTKTVVVVTNQESDPVTTIPTGGEGEYPGQGSTQEAAPSPSDTPTGRQIQRLIEQSCQPWRDRWVCVRAKLLESLWLNLNSVNGRRQYSWVSTIDDIKIDGNGFAFVELNIECGSAARRPARMAHAFVLNAGFGITGVQVLALSPGGAEGSFVDPYDPAC